MLNEKSKLQNVSLSLKQEQQMLHYVFSLDTYMHVQRKKKGRYGRTNTKRKQWLHFRRDEGGWDQGGELKEDYNVLSTCLFMKRRMHSYFTCGTSIFQQLYSFLYQMSLCSENMVSQGKAIARWIESLNTFDKLQVFGNQFCL